MKDSLDFKGKSNLYEILSMFDEKRDKRFDRNDIKKIFRSRNISLQEDELESIFEEYDIRKLNYIDYNDLENDFNDFVVWMRNHRPD